MMMVGILMMLTMSLFSWSLSGSWLTGVLTALYAVVNRFFYCMDRCRRWSVIVLYCFRCHQQIFHWMISSSTLMMISPARFDVTRVTFTVPLREHFSLPFIFSQVQTTFTFYPSLFIICSLAAWVTTLPTENLPMRLFNLPSFSSPGFFTPTPTTPICLALIWSLWLWTTLFNPHEWLL